jgi:DNA repair exonuclease SbcCD ATPase subunit
MDIEQLIKQVDWLDEERRRDKTRIGSLEERVIALEDNINTLITQLKETSSETSRLGTIITRMDVFDENLLQQRIETKQYFDEIERQIQQNQEESEKIRRAEIGALDKKIGELEGKLTQIPNLERRIDDRIEEETRLSRSILEIRNKLDDIRRDEEEYTRTIRLLDDGRRQDSKRLTDIQGEITSIRKRIDDQSGQVQLNNVAVRKLETRMNELDVLEAERRETLDGFLEKQALIQVERERTWKEWQARFDQVELQMIEIEKNLQSLELTLRDIKRTKQIVDELTQKIERRANEITEIQRLGEERFRQEWVLFKADDQKRWTNYTLTQEEQRKETDRQMEKMSIQVTGLEDDLQEINDLLFQANQLTEKRLQSIYALMQTWVSEYERSIGS